MNEILPSKILDELAIADVCITSGKLYRSIPNSSFATKPIQKRLNYWIYQLNKHDISLEEFIKMIRYNRLYEYDGKQVYKFMFKDFDEIKRIFDDYESYNSNFKYNFEKDLIDYSRKKDPWNFEKGVESSFYRSMLMGEYNKEFYIVLNHLMAVTDYFRDSDKTVPIMKDVVKYLDNGIVLMYSINQRLKHLLDSDSFFESAKEIIYG